MSRRAGLVIGAALALACGHADPAGPPADPVATITSPAAGATYRDGQVLTFLGSGSDGAGAVPPSRLAWSVELVHAGHTHALLSPTAGLASGSVLVPTRGHGEPGVLLRVRLVATAASGLADTAVRELQPELGHVTLATAPAGLRVGWDGQVVSTPVRLERVAGSELDLTVVTPQDAGGQAHRFDAWSDGGAEAHAVVVPARDTTVTASFVPVALPPPVATITQPSAGATFAAGTVAFAGGGVDEQGAIPASRLTWWVDLVHGGHVHALLPPTTGIASGTVTVPPRGHVTPDILLRFHLVAASAAGVADTAVRELTAEDARVTLATAPSFLVVQADGSSLSTPVTLQRLRGSELDLAVPEPQILGGSAYGFGSWSDGGAGAHTVVAAGDTAFVASFVPIVPPGPIAGIALPLAGDSFAAGRPIAFEGGGVDAAGTVPPERLTWWIDLVHGGHAHPLLPPTTGITGGNVTVPVQGHGAPDVVLRFSLAASDGLGAVDTTVRELRPDTVRVTLATAPAGLQLLADGQGVVAPATFARVRGTELMLEAPASQSLGAEGYGFFSWSDGGGRVHPVVPERDTTLTATYVPTVEPVATITSPPPGSTFAAGETIAYAGSGTDAQGAVPPARMSWRIDLHHDTHTHPFLPLTTGVSGGTITIPTRAHASDNIWYRFHLFVADAQGRVDSTYRDVFPRTTTLRFATVPVGLQVVLDGQPRATPFAVSSIVGAERDLGVVSPQDSGTTRWAFASWSDGGAAAHTIVTPAAESSFTAAFAFAGPANDPPSVTLTAPSVDTTVTVNTTVTLEAAASDPDGAVTQVQFFEGGKLLGSAATPPYRLDWRPTTTGTRSVTARAVDDQGATKTTAPRVVTVVGAGTGDVTPPTVSIISIPPFAQGLVAPISLTADATDDVGVVGVQFQIDGEDVGAEDTDAPYDLPLATLTPWARGAHVIRARARDAAGNTADSEIQVTFGEGSDLPAGFQRTLFASGFGAGIAATMAFAPDGRLFVAMLNGQLRVVKDGTVLPTPFVTVPTVPFVERGLLGVTFHPQFALNQWVYVYYTVDQGGVAHNRVSRFTASGDVALPGSEVILAELPTLSDAGIHNGGALHFGPDGKLYVAVGDNAEPTNAPSLGSVFGKILRFDDDGTVPADNPFVGSTTGLPQAVWARGLRNPFTFAFQPGSGRMLINDVGQETWEEIDEGAAGADYGWPATEGPTTNPAYRSPQFAYLHEAEISDTVLVRGNSIVGAAFYNPAAVLFPPAYYGSYFFADYVAQWIHRLDPANGEAAYAFAHLPGPVTDVRVGPDGALYVLGDVGSGWGVWRIGR